MLRTFFRCGIILPVRYNDSVRRLALTTALLLAGCASTTADATPAAPFLTPYLTATSSSELNPSAGVIVSAETPLPTATPSRYVIKSGDTLSQIAEALKVPLDELLLANPGIDANSLRVGDSILVPAARSTDPSLATATPVPVRISEVTCRPMVTGAAWCFALVHNDSAESVENITGEIAILDSSGNEVANQPAALLLDVLPAGSALPLAVLFPAPVPLDPMAQVRLGTAMRLRADDQRYVPAVANNVLTLVSWSGRTADVTGDVILPDRTHDAASIWIAAVAYDENGRVVGWRRWESSGGARAGSTLRFELSVYSLAGRIRRVELEVQARSQL